MSWVPSFRLLLLDKVVRDGRFPRLTEREELIFGKNGWRGRGDGLRREDNGVGRTGALTEPACNTGIHINRECFSIRKGRTKLSGLNGDRLGRAYLSAYFTTNAAFLAILVAPKGKKNLGRGGRF